MCYTSVIIFPFLTFNSGMECFAYPMTRRYASRLASTFSNTLCRRRTWSRSFVVIQNRSRTKRKPECWSELENTEQLTRISSLMLFVFLGKGAHLTDFTEKFGNLWRDKWKLDVASYADPAGWEIEIRCATWYPIDGNLPCTTSYVILLPSIMATKVSSRVETSSFITDTQM